MVTSFHWIAKGHSVRGTWCWLAIHYPVPLADQGSFCLWGLVLAGHHPVPLTGGSRVILSVRLGVGWPFMTLFHLRIKSHSVSGAWSWLAIHDPVPLVDQGSLCRQKGNRELLFTSVSCLYQCSNRYYTLSLVQCVSIAALNIALSVV